MQFHRGRDLPGFQRFQVFEHSIRDIVDNFVTPAEICLDDVTNTVMNMLEEVSQRALGSYGDLQSFVMVSGMN